MSPYRESAKVETEAPLKEPRRRLHYDDVSILVMVGLAFFIFVVIFVGIATR